VTTVEEKVKELVLDILDVKPEALVPSAKFIEDLSATSIDIVEIVTAIQNSFDVDITDEEAEKVRTIQDAVDFLKEAIAKKAPKA
jgi:acyl carrier protein